MKPTHLTLCLLYVSIAQAKEVTLKDLTPPVDKGTKKDELKLPSAGPGAETKKASAAVCELNNGARFIITDQAGYQECAARNGGVRQAKKDEVNLMNIKDSSQPVKSPQQK